MIWASEALPGVAARQDRDISVLRVLFARSPQRHDGYGSDPLTQRVDPPTGMPHYSGHELLCS